MAQINLVEHWLRTTDVDNNTWAKHEQFRYFFSKNEQEVHILNIISDN
jgi:hypothetical protein